MENEPVISMRGLPESIVLYENESGTWIIRDCETGVTTQAPSKPRALLMLADALVAYNGTDEALLDAAEDIFQLSEEQEEFRDELTVGEERFE